jgi:hypothetical protein
MALSRLTMRPAAVVAAVVAAALLAGCGTGSGTTAKTSASGQPGTRRTTAGAAASPVPASPSSHPAAPAIAVPSALAVAPGAGRLPQTQAFPSTNSVAFRNAMTDLWLAVTTGRPGLALPGFFPLAAYEQVKAMPDPAVDWQGRLWYDFTLDVAAAHRLAGGGAHLVQVIVPSSEANWISPGDCDNSIGYWNVPGSRVVYRLDGQLRSFGIASLISWRGEWYVIHFGAEMRDSAVGIVDQPAAGEGIPGPPGGC